MYSDNGRPQGLSRCHRERLSRDHGTAEHRALGTQLHQVRGKQEPEGVHEGP